MTVRMRAEVRGIRVPEEGLVWAPPASTPGRMLLVISKRKTNTHYVRGLAVRRLLPFLRK